MNQFLSSAIECCNTSKLYQLFMKSVKKLNGHSLLLCIVLGFQLFCKLKVKLCSNTGSTESWTLLAASWVSGRMGEGRKGAGRSPQPPVLCFSKSLFLRWMFWSEYWLSYWNTKNPRVQQFNTQSAVSLTAAWEQGWGWHGRKPRPQNCPGPWLPSVCALTLPSSVPAGQCHTHSGALGLDRQGGKNNMFLLLFKNSFTEI